VQDGPGADRPLSELDDAALLHRVRSMFERRDPVPPSLVERAKLTVRSSPGGVEPTSPEMAPDEPPRDDGYSASGTANSS
jgi:hypothetical protein